MTRWRVAAVMWLVVVFCGAGWAEGGATPPPPPPRVVGAAEAELVAEALAAWREVRPACDHQCVFTTQWGARLGRRGLTSALQGAMAAGGVDRPGTTPHKLRHSFACLLLKNGADLNCLQRMLGHTRLDTTGVYLAATVEDLREAMGRHPLNRS